MTTKSKTPVVEVSVHDVTPRIEEGAIPRLAMKVTPEDFIVMLDPAPDGERSTEESGA